MSRLRVRVWFGSHVIAEYTGSPALAERYAAAMARRFPVCRIISEPVARTAAEAR